MNKMTKFYQSLIKSAANNIKQLNLPNTEKAASYRLGVISQEEAQVGQSAVESIETTVKETINTLVAKETLSNESIDYGFTVAQKRAAELAASIAQDAKLYIQNMSRLKSTGADLVVSAEAAGVEDIVTPDVFASAATLSTEAYDGQKLKNAVYFAIAYNLGAARQDAFGEAFFPTVTIDPAQSGVHVSLQLTSLMQEFNRSVTGEADGGKFNRLPVIKALYNNEIFATDKNKLVPVYRDADNKDKFVDGTKFLDKSTGSDIETAALKFGVKVSLLGISQTDAQLAAGAQDNTDALDRTVNLEKVYFTLGQDIFAFDATVFPYYGFTYAPQGHEKDMLIRYEGRGLRVNISESKKADGQASQVLQGLAANYANYVAIFEFSINGSGNTQSSDIEIFGNKIALVEVRNAANELVPVTDQAYTDIAAAVQDAKLVGYTLEAYRTNSNIRTRGRIVTNDSYGQEYNVPLRAGVTAVVPVISQHGDENDAAAITSQIQLAGIITSANAVKKLVGFAQALNASFINGSLESTSFQGIARHIVNPWFRTTSFGLSSIVDSTASGHRDEDIRAALRLKIKNEVMDMYTHSNYGAAFEVTRGQMGGKIGVIIGTDPTIKNLICKDESVFALGENFEAHVVSTLNKEIEGKIFITFGIFDGDDRNSAINPLNFGNCAWAPTMSFEVNKNNGSAFNRELHNTPRFLHIIHLPILSVFNIEDVKGVFTKIPVHTKTV